MIVRPEHAGDRAAIRELHLAAFPGPAEADLVDRLRADGDAVLSLVALEGEELAGHILLSPMTAPFRALGLAPLAVDAGHRKQGIAAKLVDAALAAARDGGWDAVFVLGDPAYYGRFGFSAAAAAGFDSVYAGPYLMALVLAEDGLPTQSGRIEYAPAFAALE